MLEGFNNSKDRSPAFLHAEAASSSVENAGIAYQAPSILAAGGTAGEVALLSTLTNLIFALSLTRFPSLIRSNETLKKAVVIIALLSSLAWLPLIFITLAVPGIPAVALIPLWLLSILPAMLINPLKDKWMADIIPVNRIGRYFGLRQIIGTGSYLATFYLMGYLLDHSGNALMSRFVPIFVIAFGAKLLSLLIYLVVRRSDNETASSNQGFGLIDFMFEVKNNGMGRFMAYVTLMTFCASVCTAFFAVYMLQELHFSYLTYTLIVSIEFLARILSLTVWGRLVDSAGALRVMKMVSFLIPLVPAFWLFSSNLVFLGVIQFISGACWAAFDLCNQTYICSASPESKRLHYIIYQRSIITLAAALGPLLGALLVDHVFTISGSHILTVFLISGVLRMAVVLGLGLKLNSGETDCSYQVDSTSSAVFSMYQADAKEMRGGRWAYPKYARGTSYYPSAQTRTPYIVSSLHSPERVRETTRSTNISLGYPGKQALHYNRPVDSQVQNQLAPKELAMAEAYRQARIASFRAAAECRLHSRPPSEEHPAVIIHRLSRPPLAVGAKW
jgi:MFS family permease